MHQQCSMQTQGLVPLLQCRLLGGARFEVADYELGQSQHGD